MGTYAMIIFNFEKAADALSQIASTRKQKYYNNIALKLNNPQTRPKTYWSVLEIFYNSNKDSAHSSTFNKQKACFKFKDKGKPL